MKNHTKLSEQKKKTNLLVYDLGATVSVVNDKTLLNDIKESNIEIATAEGETSTAYALGTLTISVNGLNAKLDGVLYLPSIQLNLISIKQFEDLCYAILISENLMFLVHSDHEPTVIAKYSPKDDLYSGPRSGNFLKKNHNEQNQILLDTAKKLLGSENIFLEKSLKNPMIDQGKLDPLKMNNKVERVNYVSIHNIKQEVADKYMIKDLYYYHLLINHLSHEKLQLLVKRGVIKPVKSTSAESAILNCQICVAAHAKLASHNHTQQRELERPLQRLHLDTAGPFTSNKTKSYLTTVIDQFSRYTEVIVSDTKAVKQSIMHRLRVWNNRFQFKIAEIRYDNALEYPSAEELEELGIYKHLLPNYSPMLNGTAEATNRPIVQGIYKVVLNFSCQVLILFPFIVEYAVHIRNHTPIKEFDGATPYERYYGLSKYVIPFFQFGTDVLIKCASVQEAISLKLPSSRDKAFPTVMFGAFLGYGSDSFTFRVLVSTKGYPVITTSNIRPIATMQVLNDYLAYISENSSISYDDTFLSPLNHPMIRTNQHDRRGDNINVEYENRPNVPFEYHAEPPRTNSSTGIIDRPDIRPRADPTWQRMPDANIHQETTTVQTPDHGELDTMINNEHQLPRSGEGNYPGQQVRTDIIGQFRDRGPTTLNTPIDLGVPDETDDISMTSENPIDSPNSEMIISPSLPTNELEHQIDISSGEMSLLQTNMEADNELKTNEMVLYKSKNDGIIIQQQQFTENLSDENEEDSSTDEETLEDKKQQRLEYNISPNDEWINNDVQNEDDTQVPHVKEPINYETQSRNETNMPRIEMGIIENLSDDGKNTPRELRMVTYDNNKKIQKYQNSNIEILEPRNENKNHTFIESNLELLDNQKMFQEDPQVEDIRLTTPKKDKSLSPDFNQTHNEIQLFMADINEDMLEEYDENINMNEVLADSTETLDKELDLDEESGRIEYIADRVRKKKRGTDGAPHGKYLKKNDKDFGSIKSQKKSDAQMDDEVGIAISKIRNFPFRLKDGRASFFPPYKTKFGRSVHPPKRYLNAIVKKIDYNQKEWRQSMEEEIEKFKANQVYTVEKTPKNVVPLKTMWVHTYKTNDLKNHNYKSRCVVMGNYMVENRDFDPHAISSPVVDLTSIRLLSAIAVENNLVMHQLDIASAYLNASLEDGRVIFVRPPRGFEVKPGYSWRLHKSVYGLRQSAHNWYSHFKNVLEANGLKQTLHNDGIFWKNYENGDVLYVSVYVDDVFMIATNEEIIKEFVAMLETYFQLQYFGEATEYLGIQFRKTPDGYTLDQIPFLEKLVATFNIQDSYGKDIPIIPKDINVVKQLRKSSQINDFVKLEKPQKLINLVSKTKYIDDYEENEEHDFKESPQAEPLSAKGIKLYQSAVGLLLWASMNTRPDLAFSVNQLGAKCAHPDVDDWKRLMYCLRYIKKNMDFKLEYKRGRLNNKSKDFIIECFSDASFAPDLDRKSITGTSIFVNGNLVAWATKKQKIITHSSAACEMLALNYTILKAFDLRNTIEDLELKIRNLHVHEDNQAVITILKNDNFHPHRPIDICYKFLRQKLKDGFFSISYVESGDNLADSFTKALGRNKLIEHTKRIRERKDYDNNATLIVDVRTLEEIKINKKLVHH